MFADPAGELLDRPVIAVRDHRSNIHGHIPFHFDVNGELLPGSLVLAYFLLLLLIESATLKSQVYCLCQVNKHDTDQSGRDQVFLREHCKICTWEKSNGPQAEGEHAGQEYV